MPQMLPAGQHFPGAGVATATSGVSPKLVPRSGNSPQPQRPDLVLNQMGQVRRPVLWGVQRRARAPAPAESRLPERRSQVSKLQTVGGGLDSNFATTDKGQTVAGVGIFFQQVSRRRFSPHRVRLHPHVFCALRGAGPAKPELSPPSVLAGLALAPLLMGAWCVRSVCLRTRVLFDGLQSVTRDWRPGCGRDRVCCRYCAGQFGRGMRAYPA